MSQFMSFHQLLPFSTGFEVFLMVLILSMVLQPVFYFLLKWKNHPYFKVFFNIFSFLLKAGKKSLILFSVFYLVYLSLLAIHQLAPSSIELKWARSLALFIESSTMIVFLYHSLSVFQLFILNQLEKHHYTNSYILLKNIGNGLKILIFTSIINAVVPLLNIHEKAEQIIEKSISMFLLGLLGWILIQGINSIEQIIINKIQFNEKYFDDRKKITQIRILKRCIVFIIMFVTIASILMLFDNVRNLGAGLLTTAGILGAVGAFAGQRSLASLFSGLKIAFTQPIAIGDKVIIQGEMGQVEDITFSYVVIKLWDLRRLILPTDFFMNQSVLNLTRSTTPELLGTVFFYVDYSVPIGPLREAFYGILKSSSAWDKTTASFQVTELKEHSVEIRALVGAAHGDDLWNLRCEVREKLLNFIMAHYPGALPKLRLSTENNPAMAGTVS